jgi:hypothetical protein
MKCLNFSFIIIGITASSLLFAQTPRRIVETDLSQSFKKIDYWYQKTNCTTSVALAANDSLAMANDAFARKLKHYAEKFPSTIFQSFDSLKKDGLDISTSTDGLFRIYSWATETGGTMHFFESVMQYKSGATTKAILDTPKGDGDNRPNYHEMYTFETNGKAYYIAIWLAIGSTIDIAEGIHLFSIENGKLVDAKLIKTHSGLRSDLSYEVQGNSFDGPKIHFNSATNTIYLPLVDGNYQMTKKFILYKFTGQYFERVKN